MTDASNPCEGMDKWQFDVVVHKPNPKSKSNHARKNGIANSSYEGVPAGYLMYGVGPGNFVLITKMETYEPFQCRGCATQMRDELQAAFPDLTVADGGNANSEAGDAVLGKWLASGEIGEIGNV